MRGAKRAPSTQVVRDDRAHRQHEQHRVDHARESFHLSRSAIAVLLATTVVLAGGLLFVRWHAPHHPHSVLFELLGFPVLVLLALILGRRRMTGGG
jgi:hypothetical protein